MFWKGYLYCAGTPHGNLHHLSVTMSSVTSFILLALTRTSVSHSQNRKNLGERENGKNAGEWTRRVEISKEEFPGSKHIKHSYVLTYSRL